MESRKPSEYMMYFSTYPACCQYCIPSSSSLSRHRAQSDIPAREEGPTNFSMESILASGGTSSHLNGSERSAELYAREREQEKVIRAHYLHSTALERFHPYRAFYDYALKERLALDGSDEFDDDKGNKRKRTRTIFTAEQLATLEREFERQQYMVGAQRQYLAAALNLTENQVKIWFQNRRIKWRKQALNIS